MQVVGPKQLLHRKESGSLVKPFPGSVLNPLLNMLDKGRALSDTFFFVLFESSLHTSRLGYGSMFFIQFFLHHPETSGESPLVLVSCGDPCPRLARLRPFHLPLPFFPPLCGDGIGSRTQDIVILNRAAHIPYH